MLRVCLGSAKRASQHVYISPFFFFFNRKVWLFNPFSSTCGSRALFTDLQILLFSNFFIKNRSHGIIYTFKNYFVTVFFSFQFSVVSKRILRILKWLNWYLVLNNISRKKEIESKKKKNLFSNCHQFSFQKKVSKNRFCWNHFHICV